MGVVLAVLAAIFTTSTGMSRWSGRCARKGDTPPDSLFDDAIRRLFALIVACGIVLTSACQIDYRVHVGTIHTVAPPARRTDYGNFMPDDTNTGILSPNDLASYTKYNNPGTATITLNVDGTVLQHLDIYGDIKVTAKNCKILDCIIRGPRNWPTDDGATINCNSSTIQNLLVQDCTYAPQLPNYYRDFIIGHEYTAERCRSFWANDHYGVYSISGSGLDTNVKIFGCYMTDNVYWQGTTAQYTGQAVGTFTVHTTWGDSYSVAGYPLKADGTHNDGIQIQGGLGGTKSIWCIGNFIHTNDADPALGHPLGWSDPIPQLGTQNSQKRFRYNTNGPLNPMLDGLYANNGQSFVIQQNTYAFPQIDTVVVELNWLNDFGQGANIQANSGGHTTVQATFRNNRFGQNIYNFSAPSTPATYPIRIDVRAGATISGLNTNTWYEAHWGAIGSVLTEGRTSGIVYDS